MMPTASYNTMSTGGSGSGRRKERDVMRNHILKLRYEKEN